MPKSDFEVSGREGNHTEDDAERCNEVDKSVVAVRPNEDVEQSRRRFRQDVDVFVVGMFDAVEEGKGIGCVDGSALEDEVDEPTKRFEIHPTHLLRRRETDMSNLAVIIRHSGFFEFLSVLK